MDKFLGYTLLFLVVVLVCYYLFKPYFEAEGDVTRTDEVYTDCAETSNEEPILSADSCSVAEIGQCEELTKTTTIEEEIDSEAVIVIAAKPTTSPTPKAKVEQETASKNADAAKPKTETESKVEVVTPQKRQKSATSEPSRTTTSTRQRQQSERETYTDFVYDDASVYNNATINDLDFI